LSPNTHFPRFIAVVAAVLLGAIGCGATRPKTVPVHGTVTLDQAPLADGDVTLVTATTQAAAGGGTIKDGNFTVNVRPGSYLVRIHAARAVPGKTIPGMGNAPVLQSIIPARYNTTTPLTAEVPAEGGPVTFALRSK
jgi:hypothetical protein